MDSILELLLTSWIDPVMWFKSMSVLGYKEGKLKSFVGIVVFYLLIVVKGIVGIYATGRTISMMISITLAIYTLVATIVLFEGDLYTRVINLSLFHCILFASELLLILLFCVCTNGDWDILMNNNLVNTCCAIISKIMQIVVCYCIFGKKIHRNFFLFNQKNVLLFIVFFSMINIIPLKNVSMKKCVNIVLLFVITQIVFLWYILNLTLIFKRKDKQISDLNQEVSSNLERKELLQDLEHFKHDYAAHSSIMMNLLYCQEYGKLEEYMKAVFTNVEKAEEFYDHPNIIVAILISELTQQAKKVHILFTARIQVDDFGMRDEEICSVLHNIVMNGIEATVKVPRDMAQVSLQVLYTHSGYEIRCLNPCIEVVDFRKTSKKNKKKHGFGVAIVDKIVKRYHGTIERVCKETTVDGIGLVVVSIHIPLEHKRILY